MNTKSELASQVTEFTVRLAGAVAERVQERAMSLDPVERKRIERMLEEDLPTIVFNSIAKTTAFHSEEGLAYGQKNFDKLVESYVLKLSGRF